MATNRLAVTWQLPRLPSWPVALPQNLPNAFAAVVAVPVAAHLGTTLSFEGEGSMSASIPVAVQAIRNGTRHLYEG
jgi:hypothetical protein